VTCDQRQDQVLLYVTDGLDPSERDELRAHLASGCPTCAAALAEAQAMLAQIPQVLPRVPAPAEARDRLMQRVLAEAPGWKSGLKPASTGRHQLRALRIWGTIASLAAVIAIACAIYFELDGRRRVAQKDQEISELLAKRSPDLTQLLRGPNTKLAALERQQAQPAASGVVIWDHEKQKWHVSVFNMTPPPPDKVYELWYVLQDKSKAPIPAGTIKVDANGDGQMTLDLPKDIGPIAAAAFTDEPAGGEILKPTGAFQLKGTVQ